MAEESVVILVTGGCGYIGSKLIRDLAMDEKLAGSTIRILDSMLRERYVAIMDLPAEGDYEFLEGDIRKEDDLKAAFRDFEINVSGGRKVVDYAVKRGVERFIYSSTASVYGPTKGVVDETVQCKPISPYGESKLQAEKFCLDASRTSGMSSTVLRLGTVFGYSIGMRFDTVVDRFVYLACAGMPLTVWESAQQEKRPYLHLQDSCRVIIHALKQKGMKGQTYNVVGENATINRITNAIAKEVPDVEVIVTPTPNLNQVSYELDASRIAKLGFHPQHDLEGGVREIVDRFRGLLKKRRPISIGRDPIPPVPELRDA